MLSHTRYRLQIGCQGSTPARPVNPELLSRPRQSETPPCYDAGAPACACSAQRYRHCIQAATRSAIMIVVALVLERVTLGMIEASTTRKPCIPCTRQYW